MVNMEWMVMIVGRGIETPKYFCPKHGDITATIEFCGETFKELQGYYCTVCWIEKLIEAGVHKVEETK